ncbi:hypothetical protein EON65_52730 [archaeon]|nr:MAG: hypothetical protein EON65_52730 [archaeon]
MTRHFIDKTNSLMRMECLDPTLTNASMIKEGKELIRILLYWSRPEEGKVRRLINPLARHVN